MMKTQFISMCLSAAAAPGPTAEITVKIRNAGKDGPMAFTKGHAVAADNSGRWTIHPLQIKRLALLGLVLFAAACGNAFGQSKLDREGVTIYWGLVPAAVVSDKHALDGLHGGALKGGGQVHHLVVALFDSASASRIESAVVRAQLSEIGVVDAPAKYLPPMLIDGRMSFGQLFSVAKDGPYRFRILVKLADRGREIEYPISAASPHVPAR